MNLEIHDNIRKKLQLFKSSGKIPNIIFHGPSGSGKHTLVTQFIDNIYNNNRKLIKNYVMIANCAHGKGIRFVREDLKFFAKTHVNIDGSGHFKTIVMTNADKLTIDAQSALRRCIEQFNHTTRFFIIVEDRHRLLKPILSRFCDIFVPLPIIDNVAINLHEYVLQTHFNTEGYKVNRMRMLRRCIEKINGENIKQLISTSSNLYERGYSGLDIMDYIENNAAIPSLQKYKLLLVFTKVKLDFKCEKLLIFFMLYFFLVRSDVDLENIQLM